MTCSVWSEWYTIDVASNIRLYEKLVCHWKNWRGNGHAGHTAFSAQDDAQHSMACQAPNSPTSYDRDSKISKNSINIKSIKL